MSGSKQWKYEERKVSKGLGTSRALMKGTSEKSDCIHNLFMVDCKLRKKWNVKSDYRELSAAADKAGKIPILTYREPGQRTRLAVMNYETFLSLTKAAGWGPGTLPQDINIGQGDDIEPAE